MVRGGKGGSNRDFKRRVKGNKGTDDSDEDYVVSDEHSDASEDALEDLAGSPSEDGPGEFSNDEVSDEDDGANDDNYKEEDEEGGGGGGDEEDDVTIKPEVERSLSGHMKSGGKTSRKRGRVSLEDDEDDADEDYDANDEDCEDDEEEFMPDEDDCLDDEEDSVVKKRNKNKLETHKKLDSWRVRKRVGNSGQKCRKRLAAPKNLSRKRGRKIKRARKKAGYEDEDEDDADFAGTNMVTGGRWRKTLGRSKRRCVARSDSDFVCTGSSDFEYTISEEEREQMREASRICGDLIVTPPRRSQSSHEGCMKGGHLQLRRSVPSRKTLKDVELPRQRTSPILKGKQKVEDVVKQVCGICLSEEDKRRVRGTLNCCSHYFCFTCIMEWSKVESRCPLCKQRFKTITKPARLAAGVDLRDVVIQVSERDQIYQPSEEEIRGYLDPYENVICTECQQGGDDGLMLLCDLCDSPAHTYCVGLGREVPEGNWYCEGCRPGALGFSNAHPQDHMSDQRTGINGGDGLDLNVAPSPQPFNQGVGSLTSPRFNSVINQAASPFSVVGAATVSGRRWIQRHIHQILTGHRTSALASRTGGISAAHMFPNPLSSSIDQSRQTPMRTPEARASLESTFGERTQETPSPSVRSRDGLHSSQNTLRREGVEEPANMLPSNTPRGSFLNELGGMNNTILLHEQRPQSTSYRSSLGSVFTASADGGHFYRAKEQVQSMVQNHLKSISNDVLGHDDFKNIARSSTHTILAACGLDHRKTEVHAGLQAPSSGCIHSTMVASGQSSLMKGLCSACFDVYVRDVVENVMNSRWRQWLNLGL